MIFIFSSFSDAHKNQGFNELIQIKYTDVLNKCQHSLN